MSDIIDEALKTNTFKLATFGDRILASILDFFVLLPLAVVSAYNLLEWKSISAMVLFAALSFMYKPLMEGFYGATIGKRAVKIQVVTILGNPIDLLTGFVRSFPWFISSVLSFLSSLYLFNNGFLQEVLGFEDLLKLSEQLQGFPLANIQGVYNFLFIGIILFMLFNPLRQGVHDKAANTIVVKK